MGKRVLMAMSGGIDSSVSAILLQQEGYELVGATFQNFDVPASCTQQDKACGSSDAVGEARQLAEQLGIEHHVLDVRDAFRKSVMQNFIDEYLHSRTPNPCVLCNPIIKWGMMLQLADQLGCELLATGHYARIGHHEGRFFLQKGKDKLKDQTYFLWKLSSEQLQRTLFPLGDLTKEEVREIASKHGFVALSQKKESEEICFIPDNNYRNFLQQEVPNLNQLQRPGKFVSTDGKIIGKHNGLYNYTIGQRKGLGIALGVPAYVVALNPDKNQVVIGYKEDLLSNELIIKDVNLTKYEELEDGMEVRCRIRYRSQGATARLFRDENGIRILFDTPVESVTPGQSAVFYENDDLIGGGIIQ